MDPTAFAAKSVSNANTQFTAHLYRVLRVLREKDSSNLIFSPFILSTVIAMLKVGARSKTAEQIKTVMRFPEDDTLNGGYNALLKSLKSKRNNDFTLYAVNAIYVKGGFSLKKFFTKTVKRYFHGEVKHMSSEVGQDPVEEINKWVEESTKNKIKDLIAPADDISNFATVVVVSAVYFKGLWKYKFDKNRTVRGVPFYTNRNTFFVDMMIMTVCVPFTSIPELRAKAVALPYQGDKLSMIILLPEYKYGLSALEQRLKHFNLAEIPSRLVGAEQSVSLSLPRFKLGSKIDLMEPLVKLGMSSMFSQRADFSGIPQNRRESDLFVWTSVHQAIIEVDEEGGDGETLPAPQISVERRHMGPRNIPDFNANHSFIFFIIQRMKNKYDTKQTEQNCILFTGVFNGGD